jgi:hypothetical protein
MGPEEEQAKAKTGFQILCGTASKEFELHSDMTSITRISRRDRRTLDDPLKFESLPRRNASDPVGR